MVLNRWFHFCIVFDLQKLVYNVCLKLVLFLFDILVLIWFDYYGLIMVFFQYWAEHEFVFVLSWFYFWFTLGFALLLAILLFPARSACIITVGAMRLLFALFFFRRGLLRFIVSSAGNRVEATNRT